MARQRPLLTLLVAAAVGCGSAADRVLHAAEVPPARDVPATTATPTIWIVGTQVTITCATPGAHVFYTLDGSTPTNQSTIYSGPFFVAVDPATLTIRAIATSAGLDDSDVASEALLIVETIYDEPFDVDPGWRITNAGTGNVWRWLGGSYRIDYSSPDREEDSQLISPSLLLAGSYRSFVLIFDETWRGGYETFWSQGEVQISTDGGATWARLALIHDEKPEDPDHTITQEVGLDLSAFAGRTVRIAFRYHGLYDWHWIIDRVRVVGS